MYSRPNYKQHQSPTLWTLEFYCGYSQDYGIGFVQKQKWIKDTGITKAHPGVGKSSQSQKANVHCVACRQSNRLESILSKWLAPTASLPGCSAFRHVLCSSYCLRALWSMRASGIWSVWGTSGAILNYSLPELKELPCRIKGLISPRISSPSCY